MIQYSLRLLLTATLLLTTSWVAAQDPPAKKVIAKKIEAQQPPAKQAKTPKKIAPKKAKAQETPPGKKAPPKVAAEQELPKKQTATEVPPKKEKSGKAPPKKEVAAKATPKKKAPAAKEAPKKEAAQTAKKAPKKEAAKVVKEEAQEQPAKTQEASEATPKKEAASGPKPTLPAEWVNSLRWRSIGPANMSGRITALAIYEKNPNTWWAASASGGLLKTINNGVTFEHQFDHQTSVSIGDVQVAQSDPNIVWVGTGEANPRNSVSWGDGVYKSTDGGKTWKNMGLKKSFQIGRMAINPEDPNIVYVGALGRLWGPNEERGLYKTTDGGETWKKILYIDDKTGVIDVQMNPKNPNALVVATYERQRDGFDGNDPAKKFGPGSSVYVTKNGGKTFQKANKGLPKCNLGRMGISFYRKDPRNVYLVLESEKIGQVPEKAGYAGIRGEDADLGARLVDVTAKGPAEEAGLKKGDIVFQLNGETIHSYSQLIKQFNARQAGSKLKLTVSRDRKDVQIQLTLGERPKPKQQPQQRGRTTSPQDLARSGSKYAASLGGQRENMEQGPDAQQFGGIYHSKDGGVSWKRINSLNPRPMYYSQIRVDPSNNKNIWVLGTSLYLSKDGGTTFSSDNTARGIHVDHHSMWIDPREGNHVILGNDGGIHVTFDQGLNWDHLNHIAIGQFYHVAVGPQRDYRVYGGLQDNGSWGGPHRGNDGRGAINPDWVSVGGGDGFVCAVDPEDADQIYSESQGGATSRYNLRTGERSSMRPRAPRGTRYRFNWKTPFLLSPHNSRVYYSAGNYVFRSPYKGINLQAISPEITLTDKGSASALAESPAEEGVLYVGTTDGAIWATQNGGHTWTNLYGKEKEAKDEKDDNQKEADKQEPKSVKQKKKEPPSARDEEAKPANGQTDQPPARPQRGPGQGGGFVEMLMRRDTNGDGKLQRDEMPGPMASRFDQLDANDDGVIDQEELSAISQRMRRGRGPGGRPGQAGPGGRPPQTAPPAKEPAQQPVVENDNVSGIWEGQFESENMPAERATLTLTLRLYPQGEVKGSYKSAMAEGEVEGKFNSESNEVSVTVETERSTLELTGTIAGTEMTGQISVNSGAFTVPFKLKRTGAAPPAPTAPKTPQGKSLEELLPGPRWVSSIQASRFKRGRVYITCDGHRSNDDKPYVLVSEDYGKSWRSLLANLPPSIGSARVIREDVQNENVLYLGTEFSIWISVDRGQSWTKLNSNLPTVAVHEIAVHPTAGEIVAATHGRSLWILDVAALRQLSAQAIASPVSLYRPLPAVKWSSQPRRGSSGTRKFVGQTPSSGAVIYYSLAKDAGSVAVKVKDIEGKVVRELEGSAKAGLNSVNWDLRQVRSSRGTSRSSRTSRGGTVPSGKYLVSLMVDDQEYKTVLTVEDDPDA